MPLYMDHHKNVEGLSTEAVEEAHQKDLETQDEHGVKYHSYWYNEEKGEIFCLAKPPAKKRRKPFTGKLTASQRTK